MTAFRERYFGTMTEKTDGRTILTTPLTDEDIRALHTGDIIYISGDLVTGRDDVHMRVVSEGMSLPVDIRGRALMHAGPIVRGSTEEGFEMVSIGPTTSMRMEKLEYDFIEKTGVRLVIGKGGMGKNTSEACRRFGAVHCVLPAGNAVATALRVEEITGADWADLGMAEMLWSCRVKEMGPLIVSIDTTGRNYFEEKKLDYERIKEEQIASVSSRLRSL